MKNKIKKLKLPLSKMTGDEKNYTAVLLEDVNSNMKAFWEVLHGVKEKGDATFEQVGLMTERLDVVEAGQAITNRIVNSISTRLDVVEAGQAITNRIVNSISTRLDSIENLQETTTKKLDSMEFKIDNINKEKVDPNKFLELEKRVIKLEVKAIAI